MDGLELYMLTSAHPKHSWYGCKGQEPIKPEDLGRPGKVNFINK